MRLDVDSHFLSPDPTLRSQTTPLRVLFFVCMGFRMLRSIQGSIGVVFGGAG